MKKLMTAFTLVAVLMTAPKAFATTVDCSTSQYGGATCGVSTSTEVSVSHETVDAGIGDWQISTGLAILGVSALTATALYILSYRWYILG